MATTTQKFDYEALAEAILKGLEAKKTAPTYMQKAQAEATKFREKGEYKSPVIPVGHKVPETTNQVISRILYGSGAITREQWESLNGVKYDYDGDIPDDDVLYSQVDDEFEQSKFAEYEPDILEVPNVETKAVDVVATPQSQNQPQGAPAEAPVTEREVSDGTN